MKIRPIKTEDDYKAALLQIEPLMDALPGSEEEADLEVLGTLILEWEQEHFDMRPPSVPAAIDYYMESRGLTRDDILMMIREASPAVASPELTDVKRTQRQPGMETITRPPNTRAKRTTKK